MRKPSILRTEWMTVEWCLPPKALPISGSEAAVRFLMRYMAIWRGSATVFELFLALSSVISVSVAKGSKGAVPSAPSA